MDRLHDHVFGQPLIENPVVVLADDLDVGVHLLLGQLVVRLRGPGADLELAQGQVRELGAALSEASKKDPMRFFQ